EGSIVVQKVKEDTGDYGFNAQSEQFGNLFEEGVIDPTKVTRTALENATSVASLLLTTETVVADKPTADDEDGMPAGAGPGMGGGMGFYACLTFQTKEAGSPCSGPAFFVGRSRPVLHPTPAGAGQSVDLLPCG